MALCGRGEIVSKWSGCTMALVFLGGAFRPLTAMGHRRLWTIGLGGRLRKCRRLDRLGKGQASHRKWWWRTSMVHVWGWFCLGGVLVAFLVVSKCCAFCVLTIVRVVLHSWVRAKLRASSLSRNHCVHNVLRTYLIFVPVRLIELRSAHRARPRNASPLLMGPTNFDLSNWQSRFVSVQNPDFDIHYYVIG